MATIDPAAGFDWSRVSWGGPDERVSDKCSYCGDTIPAEGSGSNPLRLSTEEGFAAQFCDHCQIAWWGIRFYDDPVEPQHEPEVLRKRPP